VANFSLPSHRSAGAGAGRAAMAARTLNLRIYAMIV